MTNRKIEILYNELEHLYESIEGLDQDTNFYHTLSELISEKQTEIATERMKINDLKYD